MNDKLYENGYVVLENFFTDKQVDFFMTQTVESIANKEMVLDISLISIFNSSKLFFSLELALLLRDDSFL